MVINGFLLDYRAKDVLRKYNWADSLNDYQQQCKKLVQEIYLTILQIRLGKSSLINFDPITKLSLRGEYNHKLLDKVFSELCLTITHHSTGNGFTIVYFEPKPYPVQ